MSAGSEAVLYDIFGDPMAVEVNTAIPEGTATLIGGGSDGSMARFIRVNSDGYQIMIGSGLAGSPSGGIITVQGDISGTPIPISGSITISSGTITADQGSPNSLANAWPVQITDGTNTMPTGDVISRSIFNQISDATTGPVAVKPASTAPAQGDKALVVVISPNQQAIPVASTPATANGGLRAGYAKLGGGTAGVLIPVLSTTYNEQSSNAQRSMSSSSTNDTSGGTGARTVEITYYTATFTGPFTETITMNGTSAVNTVATNICYIESLIVKTAGSTGVNIGTITLYASTGGAGGAVASIGANTLTGATGDTRTLYAQHYVPTGKTCFITGFLVSASGGTSFFIKTKDLSTANAAEQIASGVIPTSSPFQRSYGTPIAVVGPSRILAYAIPSSNNTTISASLDFFEQ